MPLSNQSHNRKAILLLDHIDTGHSMAARTDEQNWLALQECPFHVMISMDRARLGTPWSCQLQRVCL
jgi:hypothetical protein